MTDLAMTRHRECSEAASMEGLHKEISIFMFFPQAEAINLLLSLLAFP
jgi:hypothetical protein